MSIVKHTTCKMIKTLTVILLFSSMNAFCQKVTNTSPVVNFDKLWSAYEKKYPFFGDKKIDWKGQYEKYRHLINESTSNDSLIQIFRLMLAPLNDSHVELHTHGEKNEKKIWARKSSRFSSDFQFNKDSLFYFWHAVDSTLVNYGFGPVKCMGGFMGDSLRQFYYSKSKDVGYVRMIECTFGKGGSGRDLMELDSIFNYFGPVKALIFDIRFNRGGGEGLALKVAGRFIVKTPKGAHRYKKKKNGNYSQFVRLTSFRNKPRPSKKIKYLGPVYLLTNDRTVSAGDLLALYMSQIPNVTIVGENTEGSFDSFRYEYLPNGWHFSVPLKRFVRASDKICYEGIGIPPTIYIRNERSDIDMKIDKVLLRTFSEIK